MSSVASARPPPLASSPGIPGDDRSLPCERFSMCSSSPLATNGTCGNSGSPSSPSPSPTGYNTAESITKKKLWDLRLLCRLIGLHSRPNVEKGQRFNVYLPSREDVGTSAIPGFKSHPFGKPVRLEGSTGGLSSNVNVKALGTVDIGANTKCLFFLNDEEDHLFICFNWFDPKNLVDIFSLTCRIASSFKLQQLNSTAGADSQEHENTMLEKIPFLETARNSALAFWYNETFQRLLQDAGVWLRSDAPGAKWPPTQEASQADSFDINCRISYMQRITCCGFSIGGPTAFYMAALLSIHVHPESTLAILGSRNVRAVAFGSPRFCGKEFIEWCGQHLASNSCSVILYSAAEQSGSPSRLSGESDQHEWKVDSQMILDPVCVQGCGIDGFTMQPRPYLLKVGGGLMQMTSEHEHEAIAAAAEVAVSSSNVVWNMATRLSPFTKEYDERYAMLHSVLHYYEALADTRV